MNHARTRHVTALALTLALGFGLAACGDDEPSDDLTPAPTQTPVTEPSDGSSPEGEPTDDAEPTGDDQPSGDTTGGEVEGVDVSTPGTVIIPSSAVVSSATFGPEELGDYTLAYQDGNWFIID